MSYIIEITVSVFLILFVLRELFRVNMFKKNRPLFVGLVSFLLLVFGLYLWIKNGLLLDYGTNDEVNIMHAELMYYFAILDVLIGVSVIITLILRRIITR